MRDYGVFDVYCVGFFVYYDCFWCQMFGYGVQCLVVVYWFVFVVYYCFDGGMVLSCVFGECFDLVVIVEMLWFCVECFVELFQDCVCIVDQVDFGWYVVFDFFGVQIDLNDVYVFGEMRRLFEVKDLVELCIDEEDEICVLQGE